MISRESENWVQVVCFSEGFVRVKLVTQDGKEFADEVLMFDIPKEQVPLGKWRFGQKFKVRWKSIVPEECDSIEDIREALRHQFEIVESS